MSRRGSLLEDAIDDEFRAELASSPSSSKANFPLPSRGHHTRNTLSVDSPTPRHGSIAGIGVGVTSPTQPVRKKKLDPSDPSTWTSAAGLRPRASSDVHGDNVPRITFNGTGDAENASSDTPKVIDNEALTIALTHQNAHSDHATPTEGQPVPLSPEPSPASLAHGPATLPSPVRDTGRFQSESASFSTMTSDSDHIAQVLAGDEEKDDEAVHTSDDERSESDVEHDFTDSERGRKRDSEPGKSVMHEPPEVKMSPEIKVDEAELNSNHHLDHPGKFSETRGPIVPHSNYRAASPAARSASLSAIGNDDDELVRAKAMELRVSELDETIKDRTVKMIIRGDWHAYQDHDEEDQESRHEPRFYLVCSDLSHEASYALEWTVGTLLKDGDTLLILNACEDENASKHKDAEEPSLEVKLESAKAAEEANSTLNTLTRQTSSLEGKPMAKPSVLAVASAAETQRSLSRSSRPRNKRDTERTKSIEKLENDFLRYVRKTALQVRCMFEVIHCRSPRHLVLNAIDELEPTLVVVGTRGLSSVKGVMLGSFSNYLVQKSSIPVMVARKRLKKSRGVKVSSDKIRMTNNLTPFGLTSKRTSLEKARID